MNRIVGIVQVIHTFMDSAWMLVFLSQQIFQDVINDVLGLKSSSYKIYQTASGKYTWERFCKNVTPWHSLYRGKPIAYRGKHIGRWCWMPHSNVLRRCNDHQHWEHSPRLDSKSDIGGYGCWACNPTESFHTEPHTEFPAEPKETEGNVLNGERKKISP